jgi:hypothetical protein
MAAKVTAVGVIASARPADGLRTAYRLEVDQRRGRLPVAVLALCADLFAQVVVHPVEGFVGGPG